MGLLFAVSAHGGFWHRRDDPFEPADCRFAGTKPTLSRTSKSAAVGKELPIRDVSLSASVRAKRTLNNREVKEYVPRVATQFRNLRAA